MSERPLLKLDFRCMTCGYGIARLQPPERCPMCTGSRWQLYPQTRVGSDPRLEMILSSRSIAAPGRAARAPFASQV
jgi:rubredoxin